MKQKTQFRRPLMLSIVSIVACIAVLIGATFAWFTDTETNTGNRIQAGTLDAELYMYYLGVDSDGAAITQASTDVPALVVESATEATETVVNAGGLTAGWYQIVDDTPADFIFHFDDEVYAPGDAQEIYLAVYNAGSLSFDYDLDFVVSSEVLADALQFNYAYDEVAAGDTTTTVPAAPTYAANAGYITVSSGISDSSDGRVISDLTQVTELATGDVDYISLDLRLDESTGNTYQLGDFVVDLILSATQVGLLDAGATEVVKAYSVADINGAAADSTVVLMQDITSDTAVTLSHNVNFDLNGYTLTVPSFSMVTTDDNYCTVDITNGTIIAVGTDTTAAYIDVIVPGGTVNIPNVTYATNGTVTLDASQHTLNLTGTTQFVGVKEEQDESGELVPVADTTKDATVTIMDNTRVVVDTTEILSLKADENAENITVEDIDGDSLVADGLTTEPVTVVGAVSVTTLEELQEALLTGGSIKLGADIVDAATSVTTAEDTALNLNGKTLQLSRITVATGTSLTVTDSATGGTVTSDSSYTFVVNGTLDVQAGTYAGAVVFQVQNSAVCSISNATVTSRTNAIQLISGSLNVSDTTITSGTTAYYAGVYHIAGTANLTNCTITGLLAGYYTYPTSNEVDTIATLTNCTITATNNGIQLYGGDITVKNCNIELMGDDFATNSKGIYTIKGDTTTMNLTVSGGTIETNAASIYHGYGTATVDGVVCTTPDDASGATVYQGTSAGKLTINGGTFTSGNCIGIGVVELCGEAEINGGTFTLQAYPTSGGTIYPVVAVKSTADVTINGGTFNYYIDLSGNYYSWSTTSLKSNPSTIITVASGGVLSILGGTFNSGEAYYANEDILTTVSAYVAEGYEAVATETRTESVTKKSDSLSVTVSEVSD